MFKYILKRLAFAVAALFIITAVIFSLLRLMPVEGYFPNFDKMSPEMIQNGLENLGLNDPLPEQLFRFYRDLFHGDLGTSWIYQPKVPSPRSWPGRSRSPSPWAASPWRWPWWWASPWAWP